MGQYRMAFYFKLQLGFSFEWDPGVEIVLRTFFCTIHLGLTKHACGIRLFNWFE